MSDLNPQDVLRELSQAVRAAVIPHMGTWRSRKVTGVASSGDATFSIDDIAEEAVESFIHLNSLRVSYYSEDKGLVLPKGSGGIEGVLIIDPIDGTRGAIAGFECSVVSAAWCAPKEKPTVSDVLYGAIAELKSGQTFTASRDGSLEILDGTGNTIQAEPSANTEIDKCGLTFGTVGAPLEILFQAIGPLASRTTVQGGFFILNSSAYELTRLVTGQLGAVVDVRNRLLRERPETRPLFKNYCSGRLMSLYGYDLAAALLIAKSAGCIVTDAWGNSLDDWDLMDTTESNFGSLVAAPNAELHGKLMEEINRGFASLPHSSLDR